MTSLHNQRVWSIAASLAIIILAVVAFSPVLSNDFVHYDDNIHIYSNPLISPVSPSHLRQMWRRPYENLYIPVSYMAYAALAIAAHTSGPVPQLTDTGRLLNPHVFHLASLALHVLNSMLIFQLLFRMSNARGASLIGALFWALHPFQVESVAWASELRGLLSAFFGLSALLVYFGRSKSNRQGAVQALRFVVITALLALAMLSKPSAIVVPVIAFVLDVGFVGTSKRQAFAWSALWLITALPYVFITDNAQSASLAGPFYIPPVSLRPLVALDAIGFYVTKLVACWDLNFDYGRDPLDVIRRHLWIGTTVVTAAVGATAFLARRRAPWFTAGLVVFFAGLLPVLGFAPFIYQYYSTVADRYAYLAMLGPALIVTMAIKSWPSKISYAVAASVILVFGCITHIQSRSWKNSATLFSRDAELDPNSLSAWDGLGAVKSSRGDLLGAADCFKHEINVKPGDYRGYMNLGQVLLQLKRYPEAEVQLLKAKEIRPNRSDACTSLGDLYLATKRPARAIEEYQAALASDPAWSSAATGIARAYKSEGNSVEAEQWYRESIRRNYQTLDAYVELAAVLYGEKRFSEAATLYETAYALSPSDGMVAFNTGIVLDQMGQSRQAAQYYGAAVKYAPTYAPAHVAYGVSLAQQGDMIGAVSQFREALAIDPNNGEAKRDLILAGSPESPTQK